MESVVKHGSLGFNVFNEETLKKWSGQSYASSSVCIEQAQHIKESWFE